MSMSIGDVAAAGTMDGLTDIYKFLQSPQSTDQLGSGNYFDINFGSLDQSNKNLLAAEIKAVLSDALSALKNSGREVRESGK